VSWDQCPHRARSARSDRYRQVGLWQGFQNRLDWLVGITRHKGHELIVLPIPLISPRIQACAASVFTRGCQIIRYLNPVISPGAFRTLILRFSTSALANRWGAVRISFVPGMHRVAAPKYGSVITVRRRWPCAARRFSGICCEPSTTSTPMCSAARYCLSVS
jgi:hypothetical protein